jgi:hypothetical protein
MHNIQVMRPRPLASLLVGMGFGAPALLPQWGLRQKSVGGDGAIPATEGATVSLCQPVPARTGLEDRFVAFSCRYIIFFCIDV